MTDQEAKNFVSDIFEKITKASTKNDLIKIEKESFESKYLMDTETFPKIDFNISSDEIDNLQGEPYRRSYFINNLTLLLNYCIQ